MPELKKNIDDWIKKMLFGTIRKKNVLLLIFLILILKIKN